MEIGAKKLAFDGVVAPPPKESSKKDRDQRSKEARSLKDSRLRYTIMSNPVKASPVAGTASTPDSGTAAAARYAPFTSCT